MRKISGIVFYGAMWGIAEATLGWALHTSGLSIGWLFWFPLAYFFLMQVYKTTGEPGSVIYTSLMAGAIKFIDLLVPTRIDRVLNPAVSIILEGISLFAVLKIMEHRRINFNYLWALGVSISWRVLYIVYILFLPQYLFKISPAANTASLLRFMLLESVSNSIIIFELQKLFERRGFKKIPESILNPALSLPLLILALLVQWIV